MTDALPLTSICAHSWTFCEESPSDGWQCQRRPGRDFTLDACINLDELCQNPPVADQSEGLLYATISLPNPTNAILGTGCDGYFEAYLDGKPIYSTFGKGNGTDYIFPSNHRIHFLAEAGEHLLAIHVRRGVKSWYFACHACPVTPPPEPKLAQGPWLTNPDLGCMTIGFTCETPLGCNLHYRRQGTQEWQIAWHQANGRILKRTYHTIALNHLEPGACYEYQLYAIHPDSYLQVPISDLKHFTVPNDSNSRYSFFFTADLQQPLPCQMEYLKTMLKAADAQSCDFLVLGGDINSAFLPQDIIQGPLNLLSHCGQGDKPILYLRGNHELRGDLCEQFHDYFATNNGQSYDLLRLGDTAFLLLDSWEDKDAHTPGHTYCQWNLDDLFYQQETEWFQQAMQDPKWTTAARRIVLCHGAPYSHYDLYSAIQTFLQRLTDPYFEGEAPAFRINLWLTGHVHHYQRSIPGTDEIAGPIRPNIPRKGGKSYCYPVLTVAGPGTKRRYQASCFRVDADPQGFTVRSWSETGELIEHIRYENDGSCQELVSQPHHLVPPTH